MHAEEHIHYAPESPAIDTKAVLLCAKCGLRFSEAIALAFGQDCERVAKLEAENAELRRGGDELADALAEATE